MLSEAVTRWVPRTATSESGAVSSTGGPGGFGGASGTASCSSTNDTLGGCVSTGDGSCSGLEEHCIGGRTSSSGDSVSELLGGNVAGNAASSGLFSTAGILESLSVAAGLCESGILHALDMLIFARLLASRSSGLPLRTVPAVNAIGRGGGREGTRGGLGGSWIGLGGDGGGGGPFAI